MAENVVYPYTKTVNYQGAATIAPGTALVTEAGSPAVAITGSGDFTRSITIADGTSITYPAGGASLKKFEATVAIDGTFDFAVTGADASTATGTKVYFADGELTLTATGGQLFGYIANVPGYDRTRGVVPVTLIPLGQESV